MLFISDPHSKYCLTEAEFNYSNHNVWPNVVFQMSAGENVKRGLFLNNQYD